MSPKERENIINQLKQDYPIEEQVKFNEFTLADKLQENMKLHSDYKLLYEHEKYKYNQLEEKFNILKGQRYDFYRFEYDRNLQKSEVEEYYLPKDKKIIQMKKILEKQKIKVDFFKICTDAINNLYWRMKGFIDSERL